MSPSPPFAASPVPAPVVFVKARLVDPASGREEMGGLIVVDGAIRDFGPAVTADTAPDGASVVDCGGDVLAPGLVDMRAFIGEPGAEHRETIVTATQAAAAGGVTTIVASPATNPPLDDPAVVDFLLRRARDRGLVRVLPSAALTKGREGREISEIGLLQRAGYYHGPLEGAWDEAARLALERYGGVENLEERLVSPTRIDRQVLAYLREKLGRPPAPDAEGDMDVSEIPPM